MKIEPNEEYLDPGFLWRNTGGRYHNTVYVKDAADIPVSSQVLYWNGLVFLRSLLDETAKAEFEAACERLEAALSTIGERMGARAQLWIPYAPPGHIYARMLLGAATITPSLVADYPEENKAILREAEDFNWRWLNDSALGAVLFAKEALRRKLPCWNRQTERRLFRELAKGDAVMAMLVGGQRRERERTLRAIAAEHPSVRDAMLARGFQAKRVVWNERAVDAWWRCRVLFNNRAPDGISPAQLARTLGKDYTTFTEEVLRPVDLAMGWPRWMGRGAGVEDGTDIMRNVGAGVHN